VPVYSQPVFSFVPQGGCPGAAKEQMLMALLFVPTKDTECVGVNESQPISSSELPKHSKP